jgi:hypothetical protein
MRADRFFAGDADTRGRIAPATRWSEWALRLDLSRERQEKQTNTVLLSLHHYF